VERGPDSGERAARLLWPGCGRVIEALDRDVNYFEDGISGAISSWNALVSNAEDEVRERD
jgi:hypothetical protein